MKDISPVAEGLIEGILRTVIRNTPVALENPADLDARSELLWASTLGCNGIAALGSQASGWPCHAIEHEVSAWYDTVWRSSRRASCAISLRRTQSF